MKLLKYVYLAALVVCLGLSVMAVDLKMAQAWVFMVGTVGMAALALAAQYFDDQGKRA